MNCQEFENSLDALARGSLADARARAEASAHAETCARCAARLADERALTEGLRALRLKLKTAEAPPRVESVLLSAMRARAGVSTNAERGDNPTNAGHGDNSLKAGRDKVSSAASADARSWSWTKTVAVAGLAAAAALAFFMLIPPGMSLPPPRNAGETAQSSGTGDADRARGVETTSAPQDLAKDGGSETDVQDASDDPRVKQPRSVVAARQSARALSSPAVYNTGAALGPRAARGGVEEAGDEEITTDFIPLTQGGRFAQGEGGHLVRVELPRSALTSFGLPVNAEAAGGRVKADVLLGEDGTARAIRFVR
ncbi:MAG: hypothetical protein M3379_02565 [Acidobacteriota bacterium]|nr:hypothetical protein [Acidobacteriota bacterium]